VTVGSVQANVPLSSIWSGQAHVSQLIISNPVVHVPLLRERTREIAAPEPAKPAAKAEAVAIDRVKVTNGAIVFSNPHDRVENRIDGIEANASVDADRKLNFSGTARAGAHPLKFDIAAKLPPLPLDRQNIPMDLTIDAPDLLHGKLTAKLDARVNGSLIMFNGVSGTLGDGAFSGSASVDAASKPLVKVDLDFQRLDIPLAKAQPSSGSRAWSDAPIDLIGLNYVDGQVKISAADARIGQAHFAPAEFNATLAGGVLKTTVDNLGVYDGQASGELTVDATSNTPTFAVHCGLAGVSALPLLTSVADFDKIEGKLQAKIAARATGTSQHAIMSNLSGTAFTDFKDGAIRGLNIAQMIRNLTTSPLSGWQAEKEQTTDLTELSASFKIDHGQAKTDDLNLVGPLVRVTGGGTIDLAAKTLGLRVDPKLVLTTEGQGRTSDPVGFGIPVAIEGPWDAPRIYPDVAGILDNPDAAYAKLREMDKGLFGPNGVLSGILNGLGGSGSGKSNGDDGNNGSGDTQNGSLGEDLGRTLGGLIQQGLGASRGTQPNSPSQQQDAPKATPQDDSQPQRQDSQPMNDLLRQFFR
jgi:AsmA protein